MHLVGVKPKNLYQQLLIHTKWEPLNRVDLDPHGSPFVFIDLKVMSVVDGGMLMCITKRIFWLEHVEVTNALLDTHAKYEIIGKAPELFDQIPHRNVISWDAMWF